MHLGEIPQKAEYTQRLDDFMRLQQKNLTELVDCMNRSVECNKIVDDTCKSDNDLITLLQHLDSELLDAMEHTRRVIDHLYVLIESDQWTEPNK